MGAPRIVICQALAIMSRGVMCGEVEGGKGSPGGAESDSLFREQCRYSLSLVLVGLGQGALEGVEGS